MSEQPRTKSTKVYTEEQGIRRIKNVLERIGPPSGRARAMRYLNDYFGDPDVQAEIMAANPPVEDPRQTRVPGTDPEPEE